MINKTRQNEINVPTILRPEASSIDGAFVREMADVQVKWNHILINIPQFEGALKARIKYTNESVNHSEREICHR